MGNHPGNSALMDIPAELAVAYDDDHTFTQDEAEHVCNEFVCPVCHGDLSVLYIASSPRVVVICPDHGSVCSIGRVTRNTVSIELEKSFAVYQSVIHNLSDLWGYLDREGMPRARALSMTRTHVCAVCGHDLVAYMIDRDTAEVQCPTHTRQRYEKTPEFVRREKFVYNFQAMKTWEKTNRKG